MRNARRLGGGALLAAALSALVWAPPLLAQEGPPPGQPAAVEVEEEELMAFTKAHLEVVEIQESLDEKLDEVQDPEEAQAFQQLANQQMIAAIEEEDLSRDRFVEIASGINTDPELQQRFQATQQRVLEERGEEPPNDG